MNTQLCHNANGTKALNWHSQKSVNAKTKVACTLAMALCMPCGFRTIVSFIPVLWLVDSVHCCCWVYTFCLHCEMTGPLTYALISSRHDCSGYIFRFIKMLYNFPYSPHAQNVQQNDFLIITLSLLKKMFCKCSLNLFYRTKSHCYFSMWVVPVCSVLDSIYSWTGQMNECWPQVV